EGPVPIDGDGRAGVGDDIGARSTVALTAPHSVHQTIAINGNGTFAALEIMFMGGWIDITPTAGLVSISFTDEIIRLSGFVDSTGDEPIISAFSESIADPNFSLSDITLEGGVLEIDLAGVTWLSGESVGFDVSVPLPLPALLLLTGLVGLGYMGRRKAA
ncbi:MAG: hypothetical protein AAFR79_19905, partial [Pseudomonadota bacterium]